MHIVLSVDHYNRIMKSCKDICRKLKKQYNDKRHLAMTRIELRWTSRKGMISATATDGYKCITIAVPAIDVDKSQDKEPDNAILIPWTKSVKKDSEFVRINSENNKIVIETKTTKESYDMMASSKFVNWQPLFEHAPDKDKTVWLHPKYLIDALNAFKSEQRVSIQYNDKVIIIRNERQPEQKAIVMCCIPPTSQRGKSS